ncbi:transcription repressor OFP12-like [Euphorbia lathyris]|uniref:transcription repressor OFP12-like n=1 Tax=Euphorbia lathyris TaxID=212925 RepID=UPI00331417E3
MSIIFWKNLLKCLPSSAATPSPHPFISEHDHRRLLPPPLNTTADASIITKNFNSSMYDLSSASTSKSLSTPSTYSFSSSDSDSDSNSPPDLAAIIASQRFFFTSPGRSNSIIEPLEAAPESSPSSLDGGIAVKKYSPDPYADFKDSMQEMIEARNIKDVRSNWGYLHELLCCYLNLNPKHTHKIIISAFSDIIVCLLSSSESDAVKKNGGDSRRLNVSRW